MDKNISDSPGRTRLHVASAGYPFIFGAAFVTVILALLELTTLSIIGLIITLAFGGFFRDPERIVPNIPGALVSPADGKVIAAGIVGKSGFYNGESIKISIFMSVFNVHVNRIPYNGRVKETTYRPGKFFSANLQKASLQNEHNAILIDLADGKQFCVVQVAGLIARRIICHVQSGDQVLRGQRFGLICFGSRLDVYLPPDFKLNVAVGDKVKAGSTILGQIV